jgi:hypothetical protein
MRRGLRLLLLAVLVAPPAALAGTGVVDAPLDGGVVGAWTGTTLGLARSFLPLLFVLAFALEAFGKSPTAPRDFGAVVWRFIVVGILLVFYGRLFGQFAELLSGVAQSIAPADTWTKLQQASKAFLEDKARYQAQQMAAEAASGSVGGVVAEYLTGNVDALGGALIDSVVSLIILLGQASFRIVGTFGGVLKLLLYVLGPLALAASVPRGSNAGGQWFRVFISVLLWPLISALLVGLLTSYALEALKPQSSYDSAYKAIAFSGLLVVTAFAVPTIATALTSAGLNAVSAGWSSINAWTGAAVSGVAAAGAATSLTAAAQPAVRAASAVAQGGIQSAGVAAPAPARPSRS